MILWKFLRNFPKIVWNDLRFFHLNIYHFLTANSLLVIKAKRLKIGDLRTVPTIVIILRIRSAHLQILEFPIADAY